MNNKKGTPLSLKVVLGLLSLVFLLDLLVLYLTPVTTINIIQTTIVGAILVGMLFRNKVAYYVFYILVTISIYGIVIATLIQSLVTKGEVLTNFTFLFATVITFIPMLVVYKFMGRDEIKQLYLSNEN